MRWNRRRGSCGAFLASNKNPRPTDCPAWGTSAYLPAAQRPYDRRRDDPWGLGEPPRDGVAGGTMFILNCDGKVGTFDPATGVAHVLSTTGASVYGADVLP